MKPLCEQCIFFEYEDAAGNGYCNIKYREQRCSDRCEVTRENLTTRETIRILHTFQKWRRGHKGPMPHPYVIGQAIDKAIKELRR